MSDKKYKAKFSTNVKIGNKISQEEISDFKQNFAAASSSMEHLKMYLPVNEDSSLDLLPVAFDSAVINLVNANDDGILTKSAINLAKSSPFKFINVEHNRMYIVGTLSKYGFATLDGNTINEQDVENIDEPFYMCLGGYIWKSVDQHLANIIEDSSNPNSDLYKEFSVSWEVGFENYDIALGSKKLKDAKIISDANTKSEYDKYLKCNGGQGFLNDGTPVYRIISDENPILYGIGITSNPAAPVSGILAAANAIASKIIENNKENNKNISQDNKLNVTNNSMIKEISDITDDLLKEAKASSSIRDFIKEQIRNKDEELTQKVLQAQAEEDRLKTEIESYKTKASDLEASSESLQNQIVSLQSELAEIKNKQAQAEKADKFNLRIQGLKEVYNLDDNVVNIIASQISDLDDASFDLWKTNFDVLAVGLKKNSQASQQDARQTVLASAQAENSNLPNSQNEQNEDFRKKFSSAFKLEIDKKNRKITL